MSSSEGQKFMDEHPVDKVLDEKNKRELVNLVCGTLLSQGAKIGKSGAQTLANSIPKIYTKEKADVYFNGLNGLLYNKAVNLSYKFRDKGVTEPPPKKKQKHEAKTKQLEFSANECSSDDYVRSNSFENFDMLQSHWNNSTKKRIFNIHQKIGRICDIIDTYKVYSRSDGYYFVS